VAEQVRIDLITQDSVNDEFVLYLVEDAPWPASSPDWDQRLSTMQDRILSAVDAAVDGHLANKYPASSGKAIRIQVDSPNGCPEQVARLVAAVADFVSNDKGYASAVVGSAHVRCLRIVTGKDMGRFAS